MALFDLPLCKEHKFSPRKDESSKIYLTHNVWLCSSVCNIAQLASRIPSEPEFFVLVNFSAIGKIAAHLRGSCLYFILVRESKETNFITNSYRKVAQ